MFCYQFEVILYLIFFITGPNFCPKSVQTKGKKIDLSSSHINKIVDNANCAAVVMSSMGLLAKTCTISLIKTVLSNTALNIQLNCSSEYNVCTTYIWFGTIKVYISQMLPNFNSLLKTTHFQRWFCERWFYCYYWSTVITLYLSTKPPFANVENGQSSTTSWNLAAVMKYALWSFRFISIF